MRRKASPPKGDARAEEPETGQLRLSLWLENSAGEVLFGAGRLQILQAIQEHGSLSAAAQRLGMSYRGLWARIRHSERRLGFPLIETHAGRSPASGAKLTPQAREIMKRFAGLLTKVTDFSDQEFDRIFRTKTKKK